MYAPLLTGVFIALIVLLAIFMIAVYNTLITRNEAIKANWAVIDGHLKRRLNLITALTTILKHYPLEELEALSKIATFDKKRSLSGYSARYYRAEIDTRK